MLSMNATTTQTSRLLRLAILALGPLVSLAAVNRVYPDGGMGSGGLALALILVWSPLYFAVPALLLQRERDEALSSMTGALSLVRGVLLVPFMAFRSSVRAEVIVSLASWMVLTWALLAPALETVKQTASLFVH